MFRDAWFIAKKDVQYILRSWEALLWLFLMPVIFFYFIGTVTGGMSGGSTEGPPKLAVSVPKGAGFGAERLIRNLEEEGFQTTMPEEGGQEDSRLLEIPEGFSSRLANVEKSVLTVRLRNSGLGSEYDQFRIYRAAFKLLADVLTLKTSGQEFSAEYFQELDQRARALTLRAEPIGPRKKIPTGFEQAIPGIMVMFMLMILLTSGSVLLVIERRQGLLRRLAATPISRGSVLLGKWGGRMILASIQFSFALLAGTILFRMEWGPDFGMVLVILLCWAAFCASVGLLLGNLARTEGQAIAVGVLTGNILAALGGCWWPIEITPRWMQSLAGFLPTGWAMGAMHKLISFQQGASSAVPHALLMAAAALVVGWIAARYFRYQ